MTTPVIRAALERLISAYDEHGGRWTQTMHDEDPLDDAVERARADLAAEPLDPAGGGEALLAAAPAAEGEVGELVEWLENHAAHLRTMEGIGALPETELPERLDRAATLLEQQAAELAALRARVVPVAVSERPWEREGWCDEQGRCWLQGRVEGDWRLLDPLKTGVPQVKYCFTHSLPFHAIPLPPHGGEVE